VAALARFVRCMRANGFDMSDPDAQGNNPLRAQS
jgi:hypothetical protein